jgi:hypothetical protein
MLAPIDFRFEGCAVATDEQAEPKLDTSIPHTARIWNYILGGKDNFAVDREVGDQILVGQPALAENARLSRQFHQRIDHFGAVGRKP